MKNSIRIPLLSEFLNNSDDIFSNFLIGKNKWLHNSSKNLEFWWKSKQQHIQTEFWSKCLRNSKIIWCIYHYSFLSVFWSKLLKNSLRIPQSATARSTRGWVKKKCTNVNKSGGNILGQSASKYQTKLFIIKFPLKKEEI